MLSSIQVRALRALSETDAKGPAEIGRILWSKPELHNGYHGSICSAPYARPAGRVLNSLRRLGLADREGEHLRWYRTTRGSAMLRREEETVEL